MSKGYLLLESGEVFEGRLIGADREAVGEVVFNTSMTGYQEIMTDPSYAGQIVTFAYPLIGNYGWNGFDGESDAIQLAGMIVGELCTRPSHYLASEDIRDQLLKAGVVCLSEVDTRALVKVIRRKGTVKGTILSAEQIADPAQANRASFWETRQLPAQDSIYWVNRVSTKKIQTYANVDEYADGLSHRSHSQSHPHVVLIDYGHKKSMLHSLLKAGCRVTVVPYATPCADIRRLQPDGVIFSNGPGDPLALEPYLEEIKKISASFPSLGICLGHQLLALAHGARTEKLKYGHRGGNHPVKEIQTGKVMLTSQNHGYVVVQDSIDSDTFQVTYRNVNDGTVEGLKHKRLPLQSIQFHPEAHPGPGDTAHIFQQFIEEITHTGDMDYAIT